MKFRLDRCNRRAKNFNLSSLIKCKLFDIVIVQKRTVVHQNENFSLVHLAAIVQMEHRMFVFNL